MYWFLGGNRGFLLYEPVYFWQNAHFSWFTVLSLLYRFSIFCRMTGQTFKIVTYQNSGLHSLILRHSKNWLDDTLLMPIFDTCSKLTKLDLTGSMSLYFYTKVGFDISWVFFITVNEIELGTFAVEKFNWGWKVIVR